MATAAEWEKRVRDWRASGKTARQFCARRSYKPGNLLWWSSELTRRSLVGTGDGKGKKGFRLARVVRVASKPEGGLGPSIRTDPRHAGDWTAQPIIVRIGKAHVEIGTGTDRQLVATVLEALILSSGKSVPS